MQTRTQSRIEIAGFQTFTHRTCLLLYLYFILFLQKLAVVCNSSSVCNTQNLIMKLPKFISSIKSRSSSASIKSRSSSAGSSPVSSPRLTSSPLNFFSPKSGLSPKSPSSPLKPFLERKKSPAQFSIPPSRSSEISGESSKSRQPKNNGTGSSSLEVLSASILRELEMVFRHFDANGDGKISAAELGSVLRSLGDHTSDEEAILMVKEADADGDGYIDLQEFINLHTRSVDITGEIASLDELRAAFHIFDLDRNGFITPDELHCVLTRLGDEQCTMEDCNRMIKGVDRNGDGLVDFEEFKSMMASAY